MRPKLGPQQPCGIKQRLDCLWRNRWQSPRTHSSSTKGAWDVLSQTPPLDPSSPGGIFRVHLDLV